ncbi:MAG: peptidoglycan-binding domain-containing protein [Pseudomonadota bacterium]
MMMLKPLLRLTMVFSLAGLICAPVAKAADSNGQFAIRGGGRINCEQFVKARDEKNQQLLSLVAGWIDGYLTATNQHTGSTYAVAPWASTNLLGTLLYHNCKNHPDANFYVAVNAMVQKLQEHGMSESSPIVKVERDGKTAHVYREILRRVQVALSERSLYKGPASGEYSDELANAIRDYQRSVNQAETGLPDQRVLWELLRPIE